MGVCHRLPCLALPSLEEMKVKLINTDTLHVILTINAKFIVRTNIVRWNMSQNHTIFVRIRVSRVISAIFRLFRSIFFILKPCCLCHNTLSGLLMHQNGTLFIRSGCRQVVYRILSCFRSSMSSFLFLFCPFFSLYRSFIHRRQRESAFRFHLKWKISSITNHKEKRGDEAGRSHSKTFSSIRISWI